MLERGAVREKIHLLKAKINLSTPNKNIKMYKRTKNFGNGHPKINLRQCIIDENKITYVQRIPG